MPLHHRIPLSDVELRALSRVVTLAPDPRARMVDLGPGRAVDAKLEPLDRGIHELVRRGLDEWPPVVAEIRGSAG